MVPKLTTNLNHVKSSKISRQVDRISTMDLIIHPRGFLNWIERKNCFQARSCHFESSEDKRETSVK